ncbi:MAG: ferredoxin--NADP reductase [Chitinophagales bacterium]
MSLLAWQSAKLVKTIDATPKVRRFFFEVQDTDRFDFIPGQFVTLDLPISDRPSKRVRSYTIASAPDGSNIFELVIVLLEMGSGSHHLFENSFAGFEIKFRGPQGRFILPEILEREICMICTGTGIAPFRSQLINLQKNNIVTPPVHLVFGTRLISDILYYEEMKQLAKDFSQFSYHVTLSREGSNQWTGHKGYVHPVYEAICDHGKKDMDFYLCGWRVMITEARERLATMGYPKERVHLEFYD